MNKYDYKNLCPFKWFVLENFPYIEEDFDALTNWQLFCKLGKEINKIINSQNEVGQAVEDFTQNFVNLYNYVHDFFDNLDVQDEIDHKLDEMVEDGTLANILYNYSNVARVYDTTTAMLLDKSNLHNNMKIKTLGYYDINDGGGADFYITDTTNTKYQIDLENGLYAEMIIHNNTINFRQLGALPNAQSDIIKTDNKQYMDLYLSICNTENHTYKLYIPTGIWFFSPTLITRYNGVNIVGEPIFPRENFSGTVVAPLTDQTYIWKLGGKSDVSDRTTAAGITVTQAHIEGITFTTFRDTDYPLSTSDACFYIDLCDFCTFRDIYIDQFVGNGLAIRCSWELTFNSLLFRHQQGPTYASLVFDDYIPMVGGGENISAVEFDYLMFEANDGKYIWSKPHSFASHNHIGHINIETGFQTGNQQNLTADEDTSSYTPIDMISGFFRMMIIDSINILYNRPKKTTINGITYYLRSLIANDSTDSTLYTDDYSKRQCLSVGSITYRTETTSHMSIYYGKDTYITGSYFNVGMINIQDHLPAVPIINANGASSINIGSVISSGFLSNKLNYDEKDIFHYLERNNIYYDATAPSQLGLVYKLNINKSNVKIGGFTNYQYSTTEAPKTLHIICKNNADTNLNILMTSTVDGVSGTKNASVPVNNNQWQEITIERASDIGTTISIANSNQRDLTIAKIWYE